MKKSILVMVLVLAILVSLVGCGGGNTMPTDPTENSQSTTPTEDNSSVTTPSEDSTSPTDTTDSTEGISPTEGTSSTNPTEGSKPTEGTESTESTDAPNPQDYVLKVTKSMNLKIGETGQITVDYTGNKTLTWKTSDSSKATVSDGKVTAKTAGSVTITVTDGVKSANCTVKVSDYTLKISQSTMSLEVGQIGNLTVEYTGTGTLTWSSSNTSVVTVSNGKVTAKAAGNAVITVDDGVKKSQCYVTVTKPAAEIPKEVTLKLNKSSLNLKVGSSETLSVTYTGNKSLTWNSTNSSIASVSNGKVTAKSVGTVTIEVSDGVKKAQCIVTVTNVESPKEVKLSVNPASLNLVVGNTSTLMYEYTGTGKLTWSSTNTSVVTVSNGKVTAKAAGQAVVTLSDGTRNAQCLVTVNPAPAPAATFKINTKEDTVVFVGNTLQIDYTYTGNKSLTWTSDDTSVMTVDNNGKVTAKSVGYAMIKVTDGSSTKRVTLKVEESKPLATNLAEKSFNAPLYDGVTKYAGDYMTFVVDVQPVDSNPNITITSSNSSVVSVSWKLNGSAKNDVTLNFKSAGTATITIKSADGAKSKSYTITVKGDYSCNPGGGQLTPEQFVNAYNGVVKANGMSTSGMPTGYLLLTLSPSELTWARAKREAEGGFHAWWKIGYRTMVLTYEGTDENGNYMFYERGY